MRVALFAMACLVCALAGGETVSAAEIDHPARTVRGEEIAVLLLGVAGVVIGHRYSRTRRKHGDDPKA